MIIYGRQTDRPPCPRTLASGLTMSTSRSHNETQQPTKAILALFCVLSLVGIHAVPNIPVASDWELVPEEETPEGYEAHLVKTRHFINGDVDEVDLYIVSVENIDSGTYRDGREIGNCGYCARDLRNRVIELRHRQATGE